MPASTMDDLPVQIKPPIKDTGVRGFLLWFKREQPALFNKIAPQLPVTVPKAFSGYLDRTTRLGELYRNKMYSHRVGLEGMGDYFDYVASPMPDLVSIDLTSQISPIDVGTIDLGQPTFNTDTGSFSMPNISPIAAAANSGSASTPIVNAIGQVIGAASQIYMTNQQAALQQQVLNTQLQRAQAGLPPLNTSLNQLGVPTISSTGNLGNMGTVFLIGGGLLLALLLGGNSGSKKS